MRGELLETRRDEARQRLTAALGRGTLEVVDLAATTATCTDDGCRVAAATAVGVDWLVIPQLTIEPGERDYAVSLTIVATRDGSTAATMQGVCELCGFEDALGVIEAKAAGVLDTIGRIDRVQAAAFSFGSTPAGVRLVIDGTDAGVTPRTTRLVAGKHRIVASKPGFVSQTLDVEAIDGVDKTLELQLLAVPVSRDPIAARRITLGAVGVGLGIAAIAAGVVMLVIDGDPYRKDCQADADGDCRFVRGTRPAGIGIAVAGGAVGVAGAVVLGLGVARRNRHERRRLVAVVGGAGIGLGF